MFLKKSFINVSAIQQQGNSLSNQNQPNISTFTSQFYFNYGEGSDQNYSKKPLQVNNSFLKQYNQNRKKNIKTESDCLYNQNEMCQNSFFSGQSFRNLQQANKGFNNDSIKRQYEIKLQKQKEFYELKQKYYIQQIKNLQSQIQILTSKINYNKQVNSQSTIVSSPYQSRISQFCKNSGQINQQLSDHLKKMLRRVQKDHQECIQTKKSLLSQIQQQKLKNSVIQEKIKQLQLQLRQKKQSIKQVSMKNDVLSQQLCQSKNKLQNNQKNTLKIIQELQMRADQLKYQNQAFKRQISQAKKKTYDIDNNEDRPLKILNNSFSFVQKQDKTNSKGKFIQFRPLKQGQTIYQSDKEIINKMYNKSMSFFNDNRQYQNAKSSIISKFRQAIQNDQYNNRKQNTNLVKRNENYESVKQRKFKKRQSSLKFKYL